MTAPVTDAPGRSRFRVVLKVAAVIVAANAAFWGFRYFDDPTAGQTGVETNQVLITDSAYLPSVVRVPAGTEVVWTFADEEEHNVVFDGFSSNVQLDGLYIHTFDTPGEYPYVCTLHPLSMKGRVIVTEG